MPRRVGALVIGLVLFSRFYNGRKYWAEGEMEITLHIPEAIARSLRIPEGEAEARLRQELATALYARGLLSFGKASELAETSRILFSEALAQRSIPRHYGTEDLNEDLKYASGE